MKIKALWNILEEICAIIAAAAIIILGFLDIIDADVISYGLLAILGFVSMEFIKTKKEIHVQQVEISKLFDTLEAVRLNQKYDDIFIGDKLSGLPNKETKESEIVKDAQKELLIVQETGNRFFEKNCKDISEQLKNKVQIIVIICAPQKSTESFLMLRNANLNSTNDFRKRYDVFTSRLQTAMEYEDVDYENRNENRRKHISVCYTPYPVDITCVMADSDNRLSGRSVIRMSGFHVPYDKKLDMEIQKKHSPKVFDHYHDQIMQYRLLSYKNILLTGPPRSGKTFIFQKLVEESKNQDVFWILSEALKKDNNRIGFQMKCSESNTPKPFAFLKEPLPEGAIGEQKYDYSSAKEVWDYAADLLKKAKSRIFIIDELGLMQTTSHNFMNMVQRLLENPNLTVYATISESYESNPVLLSLFNRAFAFHYELTLKNRESIKQGLIRELKSSFQLSDFEKTHKGESL